MAIYSSWTWTNNRNTTLQKEKIINTVANSTYPQAKLLVIRYTANFAFAKENTYGINKPSYAHTLIVSDHFTRTK